MEVEKTSIDGVLLLKPKVFGDERGYFVETWQQKRYAELGIDLPFVQDNHSKSTKGICVAFISKRSTLRASLSGVVRRSV